MSNNGYFYNGSCLQIIDYARQYSMTFPDCQKSGAYTLTYQPINIIVCHGTGFWKQVGKIPVANCEIPGPTPPSTIPTVADGVTLGWQAGGSLILVGCLLFIRKAFLK